MPVFSFRCLTVTLLLLTACASASVKAEYPQTPSYAIPQTEKTALSAAIKHDVAAHPGQSGFRVLGTGSQSFTMRLALIKAAQKTLDLQYYSIHDDTTSNLLLEALVQAAKRGVRIRFLLDGIDFNEVGKTFAVLEGLPNIEIRVFNPFSTRDHNLLTRMVLEVTDLDTINHRMHNKSMIGDNQMAILGGRNLGDEYFEENTDVLFRDIDILAAGPIVARISNSFDRYWNDKNSLPLGQLRKPEILTKESEEIRDQLAAHWEEMRQTERGKTLLDATLANRLKDDDVKLIWAKAELAADVPQKIEENRDDVTSRPLVRLDALLEKACCEFLAVSPYFVPRDEGVKWLTDLAERGVKIKILTNSLASTDVVAVHTGYQRYRKALIDKGIEIYELKPINGHRPRQRLFGSKAPSHATLHAKVYVIDRRDVMIGSFNLDPRSIEINTELAMVIHSPEVAAQVIKMFDEVTEPDNSYRLVTADDWNGLAWETQDKNGNPVRFDSDPHAGIWRNIEADFISLLPVEDQL